MNRSAPDRPPGTAAGRRFFLSCDWGTSTFRLRLVDAGSLETTAAVSEGEGILATYRAWLASGLPEDARMPFYLDRLRDGIRRFPQEDLSRAAGAPVILSGMASSSIGMTSLPYRKLPLAANGSDLGVTVVPSSPAFEHPLAVISGACTGSDVMRGEETMLVGALDERGLRDPECLVILPGTHSKHVLVRGDRVVDFTTYMTGEFFALLARQSILSHSVESGEGLDRADNRDSFIRGVMDGARGELLRDCFSIRARQLLDGASATSGYYRLSGILIGNELKGIPARMPGEIILVCGPELLDCYETAVGAVATAARVSVSHADRALVRGQRSIALRLGLLPAVGSASQRVHSQG